VLKDSDDDAIVRIERTDGLLRLNRTLAPTSDYGSISVTSAPLGNLTITLHARAAMTLNDANGLYWDLKRITAAGVAHDLTAGRLNILGTVTGAIS